MLVLVNIFIVRYYSIIVVVIIIYELHLLAFKTSVEIIMAVMIIIELVLRDVFSMRNAAITIY